MGPGCLECREVLFAIITLVARVYNQLAPSHRSRLPILASGPGQRDGTCRQIVYELMSARKGLSYLTCPGEIRWDCQPEG